MSNSELLMELLTLLMTFCATLVQMKNHSIILTMVNNTLSFYKMLARRILLLSPPK